MSPEAKHLRRPCRGTVGSEMGSPAGCRTWCCWCIASFGHTSRSCPSCPVADVLSRRCDTLYGNPSTVDGDLRRVGTVRSLIGVTGDFDVKCSGEACLRSSPRGSRQIMLRRMLKQNTAGSEFVNTHFAAMSGNVLSSRAGFKKTVFRGSEAFITAANYCHFTETRGAEPHARIRSRIRDSQQYEDPHC
jgi:hypothetical protein